MVQTFQKSKSEHFNFSVFPNPSTRDFTITKSDDLEVGFEVYDASGRLIINEIFTGKFHHFQILEKGVYFLKIVGTDIWTSKLEVLF